MGKLHIYRRGLVAGSLALVCSFQTALGDWEMKAGRLGDVSNEIVLRDHGRGLSKLRINAKGRWYKVSECKLKLCLDLARRGLRKRIHPRGGLPDGAVARGKNDIRKAWLSSPTRRLIHGNLGDAIEAGGLSIVNQRASTFHFSLPVNEVFEDRFARIVDLDGDKKDEIVTVISSVDKGASLAIFKLTGEGIAKVAQTPFLGIRGAWLNPVGIGDFDGDGKVEIALVTNPDFGGRLEVWEYNSGSLHQEMSLGGFSNHRPGSRVINMSAVADFDGDGKPDLALPSGDRKALRIISLAGGMVAEPAHLRLPGAIVTQVVTVRINKKPAIVAGLDSGIIVLVTNGSTQVDDDIPNWYKRNNETSLLNGLIKRNRRRNDARRSGQAQEFGKPSVR